MLQPSPNQRNTCEEFSMKKLALVMLFSLILVVSFGTLVHAQQVNGAVFRVEYNTDRPGGDIRQGFTSNLGECMNSCASSSECRAFTWVKINKQPPNLSNSSPLCWLKNSVPDRSRNVGMVSGVSQ
jgi:hypothetical protein